MNKIDMVDKVAEKYGMTKRAAEAQIDFILETMVTGALTDGRVRFGAHRFEKVERAGRKGRNPRTGEVIDIPPRIKVTYRNVNM